MGKNRRELGGLFPLKTMKVRIGVVSLHVRVTLCLPEDIQ